MKSSGEPQVQDENKTPARRASREEIDAALEDLTDVEQSKLWRIAKIFANKWWKNEEEDLLQTAISRTYSDRPWYIDARPSIFWHLHETLINTSWKWKQKRLLPDNQTGEETHRLVGVQRADGTEIWDAAADPKVDTEKSYEAAEQMNLLFDALKEDSKAIKVLHGWIYGYKGPEIMKLLGLTKTEYGTIERRLNRAMDKLSNDSPGGVK